MEYSFFKNKYNDIIKTDNETYYDILSKVLKGDNYKRYTGLFRVSTGEEKLRSNIGQSLEIKMGNFVEDITTCYIEEMGYHNLDKNIGLGEDGKMLNADQIFENEDAVFLIEQKMRDDHDSSKKRGQMENFMKKVNLLHTKYPDKKLNASMWFMDEGFGKKNYNYYKTEIDKINIDNVECSLFYGKSLFTSLFNREDVWNEFVSYLRKIKEENKEKTLTIPNFDNSEEITLALKKYKVEHSSMYDKLKSSKEEKYVAIREEFFPTRQFD